MIHLHRRPSGPVDLRERPGAEGLNVLLHSVLPEGPDPERLMDVLLATMARARVFAADYSRAADLARTLMTAVGA